MSPGRETASNKRIEVGRSAMQPVLEEACVIRTGDKGYGARDFVKETRQMNITPHVAQKTKSRRDAID
jgi:hypothetical protein